MKKTFTIKVLSINTEDVFITGQEVLAFMEDSYGENEIIDEVYEDIKWNNCYDPSLLREVKIMALNEYFGM